MSELLLTNIEVTGSAVHNVTRDRTLIADEKADHVIAGKDDDSAAFAKTI